MMVDKTRLQSSFTAKTLQIWQRFSLLVGYNIWPTSSSTNQNAALMIDHFFSKKGKPGARAREKEHSHHYKIQLLLKA